MKKTFKLILKISLFASASISSIISIAGLFYSWKTGLFWLLSSILLFIVPISISDNKPLIIQRISNRKRIALIVSSFILFIVGASFLENINPQKVPLQKIELTTSEKEIILDSAKLKAFQKDWSAIKIKEWQGDYLSKSIISNSLDTVYFQLAKEASKGHWISSAEINQDIYQKEYDSLIKQNFGSEFDKINAQIIIIPDPQQQIENDSKQRRIHLINRQFSGWDGSNVYVERYIKQNMNDPESYEHIETSHSDKGTYILVRTKFRGNNALGVKIIQVIDAKVDVDGNVLSISQ